MRNLLLLLLLTAVLQAQSPTLVIPANHSLDVHAIALSPDGTLLASSAGSEVRLWDFTTGRLLKALDLTGPEFWTNNVNGLAFSPDGRHLAALSGNRFNLIDAATLSVIKTEDLRRGMARGQYHIGVVAAHPSRNEFYYEARYGNEHFLVRYDIDKQEISPNAKFTYIGTAANPRPAKKITFSPKASQALLTFFTSDDAVTVNVISGEVNAYPGGQCWLPDGNLLVQKRLPGGLSLAVYRPDGTAVWRKEFAGLQVEVGQFEEYVRNWANVSADPTTKRFFYGIRKGQMISGNYEDGNDVALRATPGGQNNSALTVANGQVIVTGSRPGRIVVADGTSLQPIRTIGVPLLAVSDLATDPTSYAFAVSSRGGENKLVQMSRRGLEVTASAKTPDGYWTAISPGGKFAATIATESGVVTWLDGAEGKRVVMRPAFPNSNALAIDADGNTVVVSGSGIAYYPKGSVTAGWTTPGRLHPDGKIKNYRAAISPDGRQIVAIDFGKKENGNDQTYVTAYDARDGKKRWEKAMEFDDFSFSLDGKSLIGAGYYNEIVRLNAANGKELSLVKRGNGTHFEARFNAEGTLLSGRARKTEGKTDETIEIVDATTGEITKSLRGHAGTINAAGFLPGELFLSSGFDNTLRLWDLRSGNELAKLFLFDGSDDWVVVAPNGRFDASPAAMKMLYYAVGKQVVPLEQFFEGFYTPGLLGQLMERNGKLTAITAPVNIQRMDAPPVVTLEFREGTRNLVVEDDDNTEVIRAQTRDAKVVLRAKQEGTATISELRLYHNGKLLGGTERGLIVEDDAPAGNERTFSVTLLPGENTFRAVAVNSQRTESAPAMLIVQFTAPAAPPTTNATEGITLHLLTIGINTYKNPRYNLNYAEADASGLETAIKTGLSGIVGNTVVHSIRNAGATRLDILAAIAKVTSQANADDVFILYYAGHGVMSEGANKDFYLVPHDVTQLYGNDAGLAANGISATELKQLSAAIPAQKQLYILDACQSAGAVQSIAFRGAAEEKAIAQLARSTGTHWLTASGSEQFASEFDQLGHGAFTYALLQALAGQAAGADRRVTVNELKAYLDVAVPELTEKYNGQAQYPASFGFGQDFPVSVRF